MLEALEHAVLRRRGVLGSPWSHLSCGDLLSPSLSYVSFDFQSIDIVTAQLPPHFRLQAAQHVTENLMQIT
jgi:hypothetical protein